MFFSSDTILLSNAFWLEIWYFYLVRMGEVGDDMPPVEVVFCGSSLYFCGLAAGLQVMKQLRISVIDSGLSKILPELKMLCPDVVILEETADTEEIIAAMRIANSKWMVIVVFPQTDTLKVYSRKPCRVDSIDQLARVIINGFSLSKDNFVECQRNK
jgi:hypothetical protein